MTAPLPVPMAASSVPDETRTLHPASRGSDCEARTPTVPNVDGQHAADSSHAPPNPASGPASGPSTSVHRRRMT